MLREEGVMTSPSLRMVRVGEAMDGGVAVGEQFSSMLESEAPSPCVLPPDFVRLMYETRRNGFLLAFAAGTGISSSLESVSSSEL
jgi:hypothetical protein